MSITELECFTCKKIFSVITINKTLFYVIGKKQKYVRKIYLFSNVQQKIPIKYFCSKRCKNKYLSEILNKKKKEKVGVKNSVKQFLLRKK